MKLLELAKKNLQEFISVRETLELISNTQQTPLSYVATFLISQNFEVNISTYDADKYYVIHSNDNWNWGQFEYTSSILSALADNDKYKEIYVFDDSDIPENLKDTYWKRSELYNLNLIRDLSLDCYFRAEDIKNIVGNRPLNLDEFEFNDNFSDDELRKLLKSGIPSYLPSSVEKFSLIDDFVKSIIGFFECDFDKGLTIQTDELKELFLKFRIIIKGFNDNLSESNQLESCNIWDDNYLSIIRNDSFDMEKTNNDLSIFELPDLQPKPQLIQIKEVPLLYLNDTLTVIEASCIISGDNPVEIMDIQDKPRLLASYEKYMNAKSLIESAIKLNTLTKYSDIDILSSDFKYFLKSKKIVIEGFNDTLDEKTCLDELTEQLQRQAVHISQIENEIGFYQNLSHHSLNGEDLDKLLDAQNSDTFKLESENVLLKQKLSFSEKELERVKAQELGNGFNEHQESGLIKIQTTKDESKLASTRAENNVAKLVLVLAQMANIDINKPHSIHESLLVQAELLGVDKFPSDETIKKWLIKASKHKSNQNPN